MSKGSKERISQSIDGILSNLTIRGRESERDKQLEELNKKIMAYECSIEELKRENENLIQKISELRKEHKEFQPTIPNSIGHQVVTPFEELSLIDRNQYLYQPSMIISQYCEQAEGKRKLTIHLREIEYQAMLKASSHFHSNKGQLMDTITKALRFYIPTNYYLEAEREVSLKAISTVRDMLEQLGFSPTEIEEKLNQS